MNVMCFTLSDVLECLWSFQEDLLFQSTIDVFLKMEIKPKNESFVIFCVTFMYTNVGHVA